MGAIREYYRYASVRRRIAEYCGGIAEEPEEFSCVYLVGYGVGEKRPFCPEPHASMETARFAELLESGADVLRSIWDRSSLLGILDIEYANWDYPAEVFFRPAEVFAKMEPLYRTILRCFRALGAEPLTILTGQGYHFVFRIPMDCAAFPRLAAHGSVSAHLIEWSNRFGARFGRKISRLEAAAYEALGRLVELLVHRIFREYESLPGERGERIPAVPTDVAVGHVGPSGHREAISLDLSLYGDPLPRRATRCPFSVYQKHRVLSEKFGERAGREIPTPVLLPRSEGSDLGTLLEARVDGNRAARLAERSSVRIPDISGSLLGWLRDYECSSLSRIHHEMETSGLDRPTDPTNLPPCIAHCLREPNPHLLKPTNLQALTRVLLAGGWKPTEIAALVRSRYEEDHDWGDLWEKYDAATRARFYVRLFSGLVQTGVDREIDLNCLSQQEKGYCWQPFCGFNLADYRAKGSDGDRALDRGVLL